MVKNKITRKLLMMSLIVVTMDAYSTEESDIIHVFGSFCPDGYRSLSVHAAREMKSTLAEKMTSDHGIVNLSGGYVFMGKAYSYEIKKDSLKYESFCQLDVPPTKFPTANLQQIERGYTAEHRSALGLSDIYSPFVEYNEVSSVKAYKFAYWNAPDGQICAFSEWVDHCLELTMPKSDLMSGLKMNYDSELPLLVGTGFLPFYDKSSVSYLIKYVEIKDNDEVVIYGSRSASEGFSIGTTDPINFTGIN